MTPFVPPFFLYSIAEIPFPWVRGTDGRARARSRRKRKIFIVCRRNAVEGESSAPCTAGRGNLPQRDIKGVWACAPRAEWACTRQSGTPECALFHLGIREFVYPETPLQSGLQENIASVCAVTQDLTIF